MKNNIFLGSLIITICALMLYVSNINRMKNAHLIVESTHTTKTSNTSQKGPKYNLSEPTTVTQVTAAKGSNKALVEIIKKAMGEDGTFQVSVINLNNAKKDATVYNSTNGQETNNILKLYILLAMYDLRQQHKLPANNAITIKDADVSPNEKTLHANIGYGLTYLEHAMITQNRATAANALMRQETSAEIQTIAQKFGAKHTKITGKFGDKVSGTTTAQDLATTFENLAKNKILNDDMTILNTLRSYPDKSPLVAKIPGQITQIADGNSAVALIQNQNTNYVIAVTSSSNNNFEKLGTAIANWMK